MTDNNSSKFTNPHERFNYVNDRFNQQKHPRLNPIRQVGQDDVQNEILANKGTPTGEQYSGLIANWKKLD